MALNQFPHVVPGQRFEESAARFNVLSDVASSFRARAMQPGDPIQRDLRNDVVRVRNDSGGEVAPGDVVALDGALFTALGRYADEAPLRVRLAGRLDSGRWGVMTTGAAEKKIGECVTDGLAWARIIIHREHHRYADVEVQSGAGRDEVLALRSWPVGSAQLIWAAPAGQGAALPRKAWAVVKLHATRPQVEYRAVGWTDPALAGYGFPSAPRAAILAVAAEKFGAPDEAAQTEPIFATSYSGDPADALEWLDLAKCQPALRRGSRVPVVQRELGGLVLPCCAWPFLRAGCSD